MYKICPYAESSLPLVVALVSLRVDDTTINNLCLTRNVIAIGSAQKAHQLSYILRNRRSLLRDQLICVPLYSIAFLGSSLLAQLLVDEIPHRRSDNTGSVGIHADVVFCHFHRVGLGQASDGPLGGAVVGEKSERLEGDY